MTRIKAELCAILILGWAFPALAQQSPNSVTSIGVPPLVNFSGTLTDVNRKPLTRVVGVSFYLYKDQDGRSPLWMETQNVYPDKSGHYSVMLGLTASCRSVSSPSAKEIRSLESWKCGGTTCPAGSLTNKSMPPVASSE
jgi:hypothetical protein